MASASLSSQFGWGAYLGTGQRGGCEQRGGEVSEERRGRDDGIRGSAAGGLHIHLCHSRNR